MLSLLYPYFESFVIPYIHKTGSKHVNPTGANLMKGSFPPSVYANFPSMLRKLAVIYAVVSFFGAMLVSEPISSTSNSGGSDSSGSSRNNISSGMSNSDSVEKNSIVEAHLVKRKVVRVPRVPKGMFLCNNLVVLYFDLFFFT